MLDVVVAPGPQLDELTGLPRTMAVAQIRSFDDYLNALEEGRHTDGLYVAVMEKAAVFLDQTRPIVDYPGSFARIASGADGQRFRQREAQVSLWEKRVLAGRIIPVIVHRTLKVTD